jgi:hypothetical protein
LKALVKAFDKLHLVLAAKILPLKVQPLHLRQKALRPIQLFFDKGTVKDQFRLLVGDLCLPPRLDLAPHRLEIPLNAIYANRERVDQVEAWLYT